MSAFEAAAAEVQNLKTKPSDEEMLKLYGLYKVAKSENFAAAKQPGTFDFAGKYKYAEWKKHVDAGLTAEQAQEAYVKLVEELKEKYGLKE